MNAIVPVLNNNTIRSDSDENNCYLLLLTVFPSTKNDDMSSCSYRDWSIKYGKQDAYDFLKTMILANLIDPGASFIISGRVDNSTAKEVFVPESRPITVFRFMRVMILSKQIIDDESDFCIDEYGDSDKKDLSILEL